MIQRITETMLAAMAAQLMREQPGCRATKSVEVDVTPSDWVLGRVVAEGSNPNAITRGRILVERDMKLKYDLLRS
jgi:hypothetical protein